MITQSEYTVDIRDLTLDVLRQADEVHFQGLVNNSPAARPVLVYNGPCDPNLDQQILTIQADDSADTTALLQLLVDAVKDGV